MVAGGIEECSGFVFMGQTVLKDLCDSVSLVEWLPVVLRNVVALFSRVRRY